MKKYLYILLAFSILGLAACEKLAEDSTVANVNDGYADLTISFNAPTSQLSVTRTIAYDPKNEKNTWNNWEKFVDGALLYRVTIFVIDNNGKLVAYRNIYANSSDVDETNGFYANEAVQAKDTATGIAVKATFDSSDPMHGDIERLKAGTYKVVAVANYAPVESDGNTYAGLGKVTEDDGNNNGLGGDFTALVEGVTTNLTTDDVFAGSDDFLDNSIFSYKLNSGTDRVCKQLPQPLVMIRSVTLNNGDNRLDGTLSRTFARVRIEVMNNDEQANIGVSKLAFNSSYASQNAYLFNDVSAPERINLHQNFSLFGTEIKDENGVTTGVENGTAGKIDTSSADAVIPASDDMTTLTVGTKIEMFDCYILEGKVGGTFAFSFTGSYWGEGDGANATKELFIRSFNVGDKTGGDSGSTIDDTPGNGYDRAYGMLEYFVFIRSEATSQSFGGRPGQQESSSASNYIFKSATLGKDKTRTDLTVENPNEDDTAEIVLGETYIAPEYIWKIELTSLPTYSSTDGSDGFATGTVRCIGTGLYLQALTAEDLGNGDMTPKLGVSPSELSIKIDFNPQYETGTMFCKVGDNWYYIDCDDTTVSWKKLGTTAPSSSSDETYKYLTFETIGGTEGTQKDVTVENYVINKSGKIDTDNVIARNDFYYAVIPVSYSEDSANSSTTTDSTTETE